MALIEEWGMFHQGIVSGVIGLVILLITLIVWRRMEGKEPIKLSGKTVGTVVLAIFGALLLGIGMSLCMVFGKMILGVVIGLVGIVALLMLIPLTKWTANKTNPLFVRDRDQYSYGKGIFIAQINIFPTFLQNY